MCCLSNGKKRLTRSLHTFASFHVTVELSCRTVRSLYSRTIKFEYVKTRSFQIERVLLLAFIDGWLTGWRTYLADWRQLACVLARLLFPSESFFLFFFPWISAALSKSVSVSVVLIVQWNEVIGSAGNALKVKADKILFFFLLLLLHICFFNNFSFSQIYLPTFNLLLLSQRNNLFHLHSFAYESYLIYECSAVQIGRNSTCRNWTGSGCLA